MLRICFEFLYFCFVYSPDSHFVIYLVLLVVPFVRISKINKYQVNVEPAVKIALFLHIGLAVFFDPVKSNGIK